MRGDPPPTKRRSIVGYWSTPHARGSTPLLHLDLFRTPVYPACAGIHPVKRATITDMKSLPRMRGDPPILCLFLSALALSTPHARGSTRDTQMDI